MLLGYGNLSEPAIEQGVRLIAEALAESGQPRRNDRIGADSGPTVRALARRATPNWTSAAPARGHIVAES